MNIYTLVFKLWTIKENIWNIRLVRQHTLLHALTLSLAIVQKY